jgi:16S rRNA (cytosine967-C5)-methyltransferase
MEPLRIHSNLLNGILEILKESFSSKIYAHRIIENQLKSKKKWGSRDRAFVAKHSYEMIRWWRLLWFLKGEESSLSKDKLNELFEVYRSWAIEETLSTPKDLSIGIAQSYAPWFDKIAEKELGKEWVSISQALNQEANVILRANTLKTTKDELLKILSAEGIESRETQISAEAIVLKKRKNLKNLTSFKSGLFEIQDGGSQLIPNFLNPVEGDKIIDCCSGAGGKALSLAAKINNRGEILCIDTNRKKLKELESRANRAGVTCIKTLHYKDKKDLPCSGTGVIRRDVDIKWKLNSKILADTIQLQQEILDTYSSLLKPGGILIYATCSILPSENEDQIYKFLNRNKTVFELQEQKRLSPVNKDSDGYYVAVLKKIKD